MIDTLKFPPLFKDWEKTESIIRKNLDGQISTSEEEEILARFREIYDRLPSCIGEICIPLEGLAHLPERDIDRMANAIGSSMDQVEKQVQTFAGYMLGEIFALVLEVSRTRAKRSA